MSFTTDEQTITDLNVFEKKGRRSVFGLFNNTKTNGGAELLKKMFNDPLSDAGLINERSEMIRYIHSLGRSFPLEAETISIAEQYLENTDSRSRLVAGNNNISRKIINAISADTEQELLVKGILSLITIVHNLNDFLQKIPVSTKTPRFKNGIAEFHIILGEPVLQPVLEKDKQKKLSFIELVELDQLFRFQNRDLFKKLFYHIYLLDVYITVAAVAVTEKMTYANALPKDERLIRIEKVYHPFLKNPVANTISFTKDRNVVFLTGANMAGKSTFMKSVGISLFLAHMGFPVPAEAMEFSILDSLLTTINLSDNLSSGFSHFYAEVLRVKKMAEQIKLGKNVFIILDEIFRGTNVKDAHEATVAITDAIAGKLNCQFLVSTHIMEAAKVLEKHQDINFVFLPTKMELDKPVYTYRLEKGISDDRQGMKIIHNERILEILKKGSSKASVK